MNSEQIMQEISDTLNQKGYTVTSTEVAPYEEETLIREKITKSQCPKSEFMTWLNQNNLKLLKEDDTHYYYESKILGRKGYINFASDVTLPSYPEDFEYEIDGNRISYIIEYYQDENHFNKKSKKDFELETMKYLNKLHAWLNKLEERQT